MISKRRLVRGSLQMRLTATVIAVALPVIAGLSIFTVAQSRSLLREDANTRLRQVSDSLASSVSFWLDFNTRALYRLASEPEVVSMDPARQEAALKAMAAIYPEMYLVSTTDLNGFNLARSDSQPEGLALTDYRDRAWFQQASQGAPLALQTVIGRTSGQPALVAAAPIKDAGGQVLGVAMFATDLGVLSQQVKAAWLTGSGAASSAAAAVSPASDGQANGTSTGYSYVLDEQNRVLAHPDQAFTSELRDLSASPAVQALREALAGQCQPEELAPCGLAHGLTFTDENGLPWRAYGAVLSNGWAVIVQAPLSELEAPIQAFQRLAWSALAVVAVLLFFLTWLSIRQAFQPVESLTRAAQAVAAGDLSAAAPVSSEDELGVLARAFNSMTSQLRELITDLEQRVAERTQALEQRAVQLEVAAEVARDAAGVQNLDERGLEATLTSAVNQISQRFGFYHAGIFLLDEAREYAVLRAASSSGGQRMLARGHKLKVGELGIVGYATGGGMARIAQDVGAGALNADVVFFNNPDLPQTRSEIALPLKVRGLVIGALDVQSNQPAAFREEDVAILQILADQLALAIHNTRLLQESQQSIQELDKLYRRQVQESWAARLLDKPLRFRYDRMGVKPVDTSDAVSLAVALPAGALDEERILRLPLRLRGAQIGSLVLRREAEQPAWSAEERAVADAAARQIALALENARLLDETQRAAERERRVAEVTNKMLVSNGVAAILRTAMQELSRSLPVSEGVIRLEAVDAHAGEPVSAGENGNEPGYGPR